MPWWINLGIVAWFVMVALLTRRGLWLWMALGWWIGWGIYLAAN